MTRYRFNEGSSGTITGAATVALNLLTAATLTLYDLDTGRILNTRDAQDLIAGSPLAGTNDVVFADDGTFTWTLQASVPGSSPDVEGDNPIITPRRQIERHRASFHFAWDGGASNYEVEIEVVNLHAES